MLELAKKRKLADETIIVSADEPEVPGSFALSTAEEQEFIANLSAGNSAAVVSIVTRVLNQMHKKRATALQFSEFARDIARRVTKLLLSMGIESKGLLGPESLSEQLMDCYTVEQYSDVFERMLTSAASGTNGRSPKPIISRPSSRSMWSHITARTFRSSCWQIS